jgi:NAD(P)-dependent dehydrogenase (short-subunit alcohol dehydrogenase family)
VDTVDTAADGRTSAAIRAMHSVEGRVIIVTGSGQGVGRGMANHLAKAGASIVVAEWNAEKMRRTVAELEALGAPALGVETNIMERADLDGMVAATIERFGRVDAIINNAQTFRANAPMSEVTADDVDVFYRSGVLGTLGAMQAVYPHMKAAGWGRIVNFGSSMGIVGGETFGAYNASKEAIRALTRTAAKEWAADGIVVNAIAPAAAPPRAVGSHHYEEFMKNCPMGRNGDPELDIGAVAHFLCTDACRYLTGQTFMVDGGTFLWA